MHRRSTLFFVSSLFILVSCTTAEDRVVGFEEAFVGNPLMAEAVADQLIDFVTTLQIRANEEKQPIKDPRVLRAIDETFIRARAMLKKAYMEQDAGKKGGFHGVAEVLAQGAVLLYDESLFFGMDFSVNAVSGTHVFLAEHVTPTTSAELKSQATLDLGPLQNIIGPQEYRVGKLTEDAWNRYRTVALYSPLLDRVVAYAQIRQRVKKKSE